MSQTIAKPRVLELDATRGAAMLAVCISHSSDFVPKSSPFWSVLIILGYVATPTFLLLSGVVSGYLITVNKNSPSALRARLLDRGLFLLLVAHVMLAIVHAAWEPLHVALLQSFYITDAVGVGLIVAAFIARFITPRRLLIAGGILLVSTFCMAAFDPFENGPEWWLSRLLFGTYIERDVDDGYVVPLLPYLGIYAIGLAAGIQYGAIQLRQSASLEVAKLCARIGAACIALGLLVKISGLMMKSHLSADAIMPLYRLTNPFQKLPPGLDYVLTFGGAGIILTGFIMWATQSAAGKQLVRTLAVVGRASLFIFVLQFFVYYFPGRVFHIAGIHHVWLIAFPTTLMFLWFAASLWDRSSGNRLLTLGLRNFFFANKRHTTALPAKASM